MKPHRLPCVALLGARASCRCGRGCVLLTALFLCFFVALDVSGQELVTGWIGDTCSVSVEMVGLVLCAAHALLPLCIVSPDGSCYLIAMLRRGYRPTMPSRLLLLSTL